MRPDDDPLKAELLTLRRQVRALAVLLVFTLLLSAASLWLTSRTGPADAPPGVLVGRSLYLRELPDEPYVRLKFLQGGAGLILSDAEGRGQAHLIASPGNGRLLLGSGPPRLELDGGPATPALTLRDGKGRPRVLLEAGETPRLALLDPQGRVRLQLSAGAEGAILSLADSKGQAGARLTQRGGSFVLRIVDQRGEVVHEAPPPAKP